MKSFIKLFVVSIALVPLFAFAADTVLNTNKVKVGQKTSAADKVIEFDTNSGAANPKLKVLPSENKIKFSNDGVTFKDIGSGGGGGGGTNYLQDLNGDFETGIQSWINSGGTFVGSLVNPIQGLQSGVFTASTTGQFVETALITKTLGAGGRSCSASLDYNWAGVAGQLQVSLLDSTNAVIAGPVDLAVTTSTQSLPTQLPLFDCDAATQFKIRITSTAASAAIKLDDAFIGYGKNSQSISQAEIFGTLTYPGVTSCTWSWATGTPSQPPLDADCLAPVVTNKALAPATKIPSVRFATMPAGNYKVTFVGSLFTGNSTVGSSECNWQIHDGVTATGKASVFEQVNNGNDSISTLVGMFSYSTTQTNKQFDLFGARIVGNATCALDAVNANKDAAFIVEYYPLNANNAITLETSGWRVDASVSGSNPSLTAASVASYTEITDAGLSITANSGSLPVQIPCSSVNPSTGSSCSVGNESVGVVATVPVAGPALVCASFTHLGNIGASAVLETAFTVVETPNNSQTVLQTNNTRMADSIQVAGSISNHPHTSCGVMNFSTAGQKTLRLFYEQLASGAVSASLLLADASALVGQRDVHFTIVPIGSQFPTPVFTDLQNSLNAKVGSGASGTVIYGIDLSDTGTCTAQGPIGGNWVSSVTDNGTGDCTINFATGFFDGVTVPRCTFTSGNAETSIGTQSPTAFRFTVRNSAGTGAAFSIGSVICIGKK